MEIKTKFNSGDLVWIMEKNVPVQVRVCDVVIRYYNRTQKLDIGYSHHDGGGADPENIHFATKEELLKSL